MDENPVHVKLVVNGRYPDGVPISTMPPQVLQTLPELTEDLEYRFINDNLIILDTHAHVIADFIDNALPEVARHVIRCTRLACCRLSLIAVCAACSRPAVGDAAATPRCRRAGRAPAGRPSRCPNKNGSFKFAVLGDFGTGVAAAVPTGRADGQAALDVQVRAWSSLVGDNMYGGERPQDFKKKFEIPYKPLLDAGVKFYASLGNHDSREQRYYKLFNMDGKLYYTFKPAAGRPLLHAREHLSRARTDPVARERTQESGSRVEDRLSSITRSIRQATGTARTSVCARCSSRCSSNTTSASCSPGTTISTSASSRRRASPISSSDPAASCGRATSTRRPG